MRINDHFFSKLSALVVLLGMAGTSQAFSFIPNEGEFYSWDERCRALYVSTSIGAISKYSHMVSPHVVRKWRKVSASQGGPWHYCEGLIHLKRAKVAINDEQRTKHYKAAYSAIRYTYMRIRESDPWSAEMAIKLAEAADGLGNTNEANRYLKQVIERFPNYPSAYTGKSYFLWKKGRVREAIEVLEQAKLKLKQPSSEIYYFLGLYYVDENNLAKAKENAEKAYSMGYPLTGLKNKIDRLESK